jgi:hypothetical protein
MTDWLRQTLRGCLTLAQRVRLLGEEEPTAAGRVAACERRSAESSRR